MKKSILWTGLFLFLSCQTSLAHFGMIIPSESMVTPKTKNITIKLAFAHPFEGTGMPLVKPARFAVKHKEETVSLSPRLNPISIMGEQGWQADYQIKRPGVYSFYFEPEPYWEPAEDCFIIHYTKTVVAAFGDEEGWDEPAGLATEIIPLTRPFGLYAGNIFQGKVLLAGKPVPGAEIEIEYYNQDGKAHAPTEYMITQVVKADSNGVFTYAAPRSGWWGFAALNSADYKIKHKSEPKAVELGAVLWVEFKDWQE